ncbi:hypothetical protein VV869_18275 [Photobacterium sp. MCCC 1A19761]|uniref:hypothetical protein n=1 Tax=Photobacterium sp. MCCC 1A19761 TaxID=3115000 RepID=UPI00307D9055
MFDWLRNLFSSKPEAPDDNLVEKQSDDAMQERHRQEEIARGSPSDDDNES